MCQRPSSLLRTHLTSSIACVLNTLFISYFLISDRTSKMRSLGLCFLSAAILTALIFLAIGSNTLVPFSGNVSPINSQAVKAMGSGRKLKRSGDMYRRLVGDLVNLDYPGYDPAPSSKASVQPKPIEHGTPLMPYVPGPTHPPPGPGEVQFP